jgi:hypothetical protein
MYYLYSTVGTTALYVPVDMYYSMYFVDIQRLKALLF